MTRYDSVTRWALILWCLSILLEASVTEAQTFSEQGSTILGGVNYDSRSASLADIDNDGDLDLMFQGGGDPNGANARQLFRNNIIGTGSMTYSNISGILPEGLDRSWSAAWGDYDGDGFVDMFVGQSNTSTNKGDLVKNSGGASFANVSIATGLDDPGFHQNVAWSDIDGDRDLDLILAMEGPERHEIYLQGSGGSFTPVGALVGFQEDFGTKAYGMAIGDTDGDGDLDIYISTCKFGGDIRNNFYENQLADTGTLSFIDIADTNGTQYMDNSYGSEFLDFDDDGDLDLFMVGADSEASKIFRNDGNNQFTDVDAITGQALLSDTSGDLNGGRAVDYDNDGDLDLFFHDHKPNNGKDLARKLYRNDGNWQFTDVTVAEGLNDTNKGSYDSAWGDIDLDGDQDLIATTSDDDPNTPEQVFISDATTNGNHWLYVELSGPTDNTTGIGASLYATINEGTPQERTIRREANTNAGTFNQSDLPVHFGLGAATVIDELEIHWPDGAVQTLLDVPIDQYLTVNTPGDFDGDHDVDADDLAQWEGDYGLNSDSDSNLDGRSDGLDFLAWQQQLGNGVVPLTAVATAVPEPAAMVLMLVSTLALIGGRYQRFERSRRVVTDW